MHAGAAFRQGLCNKPRSAADVEYGAPLDGQRLKKSAYDIEVFAPGWSPVYELVVPVLDESGIEPRAFQAYRSQNCI